jgi:hypothetical protein
VRRLLGKKQKQGRRVRGAAAKQISCLRLQRLLYHLHLRPRNEATSQLLRMRSNLPLGQAAFRCWITSMDGRTGMDGDMYIRGP